MAVNSINNSKAKCGEAENPLHVHVLVETHPSLLHMARGKGKNNRVKMGRNNKRIGE